jgi:hypothetical protein
LYQCRRRVYRNLGLYKHHQAGTHCNSNADTECYAATVFYSHPLGDANANRNFDAISANAYGNSEYRADTFSLADAFGYSHPISYPDAIGYSHSERDTDIFENSHSQRDTDSDPYPDLRSDHRPPDRGDRLG